MRILAIALALVTAGCAGDTVLRIEIPDPGVSPAPTSLRVALTGVNAAPRTIAPVVFPGTLVIHGLPASLSQLCVEVDGLDDAGTVIDGGAVNVVLAAHATTRATVTLSSTFVGCDALPPDDLALGAPADLAGGGTVSDLSPANDLGAVAVCPTNAIFCDDFETGNLSKWTSSSVKQDAGTLGVQSTTKKHGSYALRALANGMPGGDVYAEAERGFPPTAPPFALRANVYFPATLGHFDQLIAIYENPSGSINSFAIGGDGNNSIWEVSENESTAGDRLSDMVPTGAGQWHCVELVIDAAGMVDFYVDGHHLIGPFARASAVTYSTLLVGVTRSVDTDFTAYIDDVAIAPTRLYCPP
ncbi:MAG: LamG-like jellyroll fold domain-containing protein [Polyangia bacterium]